MVRAKNDDSAYVGRYLAVVADGMGGHAGGNVASASTVLDLVHLDHGSHGGKAATHLADEIQTANSLLSELVTTNPQLAGMGTTVTAILLEDSKLQLAHIGDSRAYRLKDGTFAQITTDHTFVQRLIDEGRLRPEEAEIHPHKNVLMRVLGDVDASPELDLEEFDADPGERWLLCSDGLNAVLNDRVVEQVMRETGNIRACVDTLVELTLAGGSPDNITIVVVEVVEADDDDAVPPVTIPPARQAAGERDRPGDVAAAAHGIDRNGDLPGAAIRADIIRQDLLTRPHVLVGSAALATETGQIPIVTQRSTERRAAMMLTHKAEPGTDDAGEDAGHETGKRKRRWLVPAFLSLMTLILIAVLGLGYTWTQTRYYVAESENRVAIFTGVPQRIGPISLSELYEMTDIPVSNLPEYQRSQVSKTLPAASLEEAERIVGDLRSELRAVSCDPEAPQTPSASPAPSGTAGAPAPTPSATAGGSARPSATPSATPSPSARPSVTAAPSATSAPSPTAGASAGPSAAPAPSPSPSSPAVACGGAANE
ncbi:protein phosphatase 2C domain-containing protein [Arthrobacter sp. B0490]|uniref:protein phosphatase 2C domain-containing protein n=1 Tax=Arthrobacter sp. B0490 TaxID=2058891 RepID=UPI000CE51C14|nr:protein phosphatase 2C domain-containing protein [Arthrobacter sp. B0490]